MKKCSHILLSVLLSMTILFIGTGVDVVQCSCTGMAKVVPCGMEVEDKGCTPNEGCLTVEHVQLSPTLTAQTITYDFHVLQPLLTILPSLVAEWMQPTTCKAMVQSIRVMWKSPPRVSDIISLKHNILKALTISKSARTDTIDTSSYLNSMNI